MSCLVSLLFAFFFILTLHLNQIHQLLQSIPLEKYKEPNTKETIYSCEWVKDAMMSRTGSEGSWPQLMIFPEGTTHNPKALIHFKNGPFLPGKPVQPITVKFPYRHCDLSWVTGGVSQPQLLYRMMCQFYNNLEVEYLPVYTPSEEERGGGEPRYSLLPLGTAHLLILTQPLKTPAQTSPAPSSSLITCAPSWLRRWKFRQRSTLTKT